MKKLTLTIPLQDLKDILWAIDDCLIRKCEKQEKLKIIYFRRIYRKIKGN